jgi:uncharacterized protein YprB with RNaseH-like and TPR domain
MILHTFSILNGIGLKRERRLWREGVLTWEDFLSAESLGGISLPGKSFYDISIAEASERLGAGDAPYFASLVPRSEHWRLFNRFRDEAYCLDIETNGLPAGSGGYPTVVGISGPEGCVQLVRGRDLTAGAVMDALSGAGCLITFFGSAFDIPFLERTLPGFSLPVPHFDLCFGLRRLGIGGGLKKIEGLFGIKRDESTSGMDGYDAVLLWGRAERGDSGAIELLLRYNREDTVNLSLIAPAAYSMLREATGITEHL